MTLGVIYCSAADRLGILTRGAAPKGIQSSVCTQYYCLVWMTILADAHLIGGGTIWNLSISIECL